MVCINYFSHFPVRKVEKNIRDFSDRSERLGKHKLNVEVDVQTTPLEYLYLEQYHGFNHPLTGTK